MVINGANERASACPELDVVLFANAFKLKVCLVDVLLQWSHSPGFERGNLLFAGQWDWWIFVVCGLVHRISVFGARQFREIRVGNNVILKQAVYPDFPPRRNQLAIELNDGVGITLTDQAHEARWVRFLGQFDHLAPFRSL